jgi:hypothetical protein
LSDLDPAERWSHAGKLVRVMARGFVAGFVLDGEVCVHAADILRSRKVIGRNGGVIGMTRRELHSMFVAKGWEARQV